jgi:hypothetical protein
MRYELIHKRVLWDEINFRFELTVTGYLVYVFGYTVAVRDNSQMYNVSAKRMMGIIIVLNNLTQYL